MTLAVVGALFGALPASQPAQADVSYEPYYAWNGYRIYLSPARHSPDNVGCGGYKENSGSYGVAIAATNSSYVDGVQFPMPDTGNLRVRGYKVRIGTGTVRTAIDNSNAWAAHRHVPIHSNAVGSYTCSQSRPGYGTWVMYRSSGGSNLAADIESKIGPKSPGTGDRICTDQVCFGGTLAELSQTNAVAAYLESEFHTWNSGVAWLQSTNRQWGWRLASGIDTDLGFPR